MLRVWLVVAAAGAARAASVMPDPIPIDGMFDDQLYQGALDAELCRAQLQEMNAFEFYDASFRIPQGLSGLNLVSFGNYHQCLSIRQERGAATIEGKHCLVHIPLDSPLNVTLPELPWNITIPRGALQRYASVKRGLQLLTGARDVLVRNYEEEIGDNPLDAATTQLQLGVCIPKSCPVPQALGILFNSSLHTVNYEEGQCRLPDDRPYAPVDYLAIVIFSLIGLVTIISTGYDLRHTVILKRDPKQRSALYSCCSVFTNTRRLFTFRDAPGAVTCLDGIRSLSILWVILGHSGIRMLSSFIVNLAEALQFLDSVEALWISSANIAVDTFFMLSGLLVVYTSIPKLTQMSLLKNLPMFYLNRLLRVFPILAAAVLLQASLFFHVTDGVNWTFAATNTKSCRQYWWAALLHIQNYYNPQQECLPHTWYLAVDIQLYFLSPLVLVWLLGSRRLGWTSLATTLLLNFTASTIYIFMNNIPSNTFSNGGMAFWTKYYVNVLTRAPVFFVGMLVGYVLHICKGKKVDLPMWLVMVCWASSMALFSIVIYSYYPMTSLDISQVYINLCNAYMRSLWSVALGWLIFACVHGYGGPIDWFLSLTVFKFIARISYAMYIFHYPMQFIKAAAILAPMHFSIVDIMDLFVYDLALALLVATAVCVLIDAPFSTLQRLMLGGGGKKPAPKKQPPSIVVNGIKGHAPGINGHIPAVHDHCPGVNGHTLGVNGHTPDENGHSLGVSHTPGENGHTLGVSHTPGENGHTLGVNGHTPDENGHSLGVSHTPGENGHTLGVNGHIPGENGHTLGVNGHIPGENGHTLGVNGPNPGENGHRSKNNGITNMDGGDRVFASDENDGVTKTRI